MRRAFYDNVSPRFFYAIGTPLDVTYERCCVKLCCVRLCCRFCCINRKWNFDPIKNDLRIDALLKTSRSAAVHDSNSIERSKIVRKCEQMFKYSNDTCGLLKLKWYVNHILILQSYFYFSNSFFSAFSFFFLCFLLFQGIYFGPLFYFCCSLGCLSSMDCCQWYKR
jgi:hypothetical protein